MLKGDPFCALLVTRERGHDTNELPRELSETIVHTSDLPAPSVVTFSNPGSEAFRANPLRANPLLAGTAAESGSAKSTAEGASREADALKQRSAGRSSSSSLAGLAGREPGNADGVPDWTDRLTQLGEFRVERKLGQGGMGVVLLAEDLRLGRQVALKVMQPRYASDDIMRQRFLREARSMAAIKSDYVVTIYEVGISDGLPFLAMELLQGESLEAYRQRLGRVPIDNILRFGRQAAQGLAAAHGQGVIHRDIKPSNLWIESPTGRVKILDFGLARAVHDSAQVSLAGKVIGTPAFMAPEQARGDEVDHRADLFSLGCVLYWLAANELPFKGVDLMSTLMALAMHEPSPVTALSADVPQGVSDLIMGLLKKNPNERIASGRELADIIRQLEAERARG
jgi:serine/threonine protein kinase